MRSSVMVCVLNAQKNYILSFMIKTATGKNKGMPESPQQLSDEY